jgi:mRNA-degrading endonuclease YafQ of YafQ-DinJ toxin-antitoxin module
LDNLELVINNGKEQEKVKEIIREFADKTDAPDQKKDHDFFSGDLKPLMDKSIEFDQEDLLPKFEVTMNLGLDDNP